MEIELLENEYFLPVVIHEEKFDYLVSNLGRLISLKYKNPKLMRPTQEPGRCGRPGYLNISLRNTAKTKYLSIRMHRLVAIMFLPNPFNHPQVNHKDGNKTNNQTSNLEWCTSLDNIHHSFAEGLNVPLKGDKHHKYNKGRKVILNGKIYNSIAECARLNKVPRTSLCSELEGRMKTKIGIAYV